MRVTLITTSNNIQDLKLIAETDAEQTYLRQIADAGTLTSIARTAGLSVVFRPVSVMEEDYASNTSSSISPIGRYNFELRQNEDKITDLAFTTDGNPINLSTYSGIVLQIKNGKGGAAAISLTIGNGLEVRGEANNVLRVTLTAVQTRNLVLPEYFYDVLFVAGTQNHYQLEGLITIIPSVSR